jgi:hypothetical protein
VQRCAALLRRCANAASSPLVAHAQLPRGARHAAAPCPTPSPRTSAGEDAKSTKGQSYAHGYARPRAGGSGGSSQRAAAAAAGGEADAQLLLWQLLHKVLLNYVPPPPEGTALAAALASARRAARGGPQQQQQQELPLGPMQKPEHEASYAMLHARVVPNSRVIQFLGQQMFGQGHFWCGSAGLHDLSTSSVMLFGSIGGNSGFHLDPSAAENTAWPVDLRFEEGDASLAARATRGAHAAYARQVRLGVWVLAPGAVLGCWRLVLAAGALLLGRCWWLCGGDGTGLGGGGWLLAARWWRRVGCQAGALVAGSCAADARAPRAERSLPPCAPSCPRSRGGHGAGDRRQRHRQQRGAGGPQQRHRRHARHRGLEGQAGGAPEGLLVPLLLASG